jgi:hypothetical protein
MGLLSGYGFQGQKEGLLPVYVVVTLIITTDTLTSTDTWMSKNEVAISPLYTWAPRSGWFHPAARLRSSRFTFLLSVGRTWYVRSSSTAPKLEGDGNQTSPKHPASVPASSSSTTGTTSIYSTRHSREAATPCENDSGSLNILIQQMRDVRKQLLRTSGLETSAGFFTIASVTASRTHIALGIELDGAWLTCTIYSKNYTRLRTPTTSYKTANMNYTTRLAKTLTQNAWERQRANT